MDELMDWKHSPGTAVTDFPVSSAQISPGLVVQHIA